MSSEEGNKKTQTWLGEAVFYKGKGTGVCGGVTSSKLHLNTKRRDRNSITRKWKSAVV